MTHYIHKLGYKDFYILLRNEHPKHEMDAKWNSQTHLEKKFQVYEQLCASLAEKIAKNANMSNNKKCNIRYE